MTKESYKKGMAGRLLAAGCSLALAASLTPAAALTALATGTAVGTDMVDVTVQYANGEVVGTSTVDLTTAATVAGNVSTLYFDPTHDVMGTTVPGQWGVVTSGKTNATTGFVTLDTILKTATIGQKHASDYWKAGATLKVKGTASNAAAEADDAYTLTYDQSRQYNKFYLNATTDKLGTTYRAMANVPGIALNAMTSPIPNNVTASEQAANNAADAESAGMGTHKCVFMNGLNPATASATTAQKAQYVYGTKTLTIEISNPSYPNTNRIYGENWYNTMAEIVEKTGSYGNDEAVVVAGANNYQDALTASGLAGQLGCPVLMTGKDALTKQVADEINGLFATNGNKGVKVYLLGGELAVSKKVEDQLNGLEAVMGQGTGRVERLWGETASETSLAVYEKMQDLAGANTSEVIVSTSIDFRDALSISPYAYAKKTPIVLTNSANVLDDEAESALQEATEAVASARLESAVITGGPLAVSEDVEGQLSGVEVKRIQGATAYETSNDIAEWLYEDEGFDQNVATLATGNDYLDALSASQYCGKNNLVLVLASDGAEGEYAIDNFLTENGAGAYNAISRATIFGGSLAFSDSLQGKVSKAVTLS